MKFFSEFKKFITRGNVLDLAVGMIIGVAFTAIVTAIVTNIFTPLINLIPVSETGLQTVLREAVIKDGVIVTSALIIDWGAVISAVISFFVTAFILFTIVKAVNRVKDGTAQLKKKNKKQAAESEVTPEPEPTPAPPTTEQLLGQIIELLKGKNLDDLLSGAKQAETSDEQL